MLILLNTDSESILVGLNNQPFYLYTFTYQNLVFLYFTQIELLTMLRGHKIDNNHSDPLDVSEWICIYCTFRNTAGNTMCNICDAPQ
jgi:hypothetical protein